MTRRTVHPLVKLLAVCGALALVLTALGWLVWFVLMRYLDRYFERFERERAKKVAPTVT